jgi:hypothetical protein
LKEKANNAKARIDLYHAVGVLKGKAQAILMLKYLFTPYNKL